MTCRVLLLAVSTIVCATSGCDSAPQIKPRNHVTAQLDLGATRTNVDAQVSDLVTLELPPVELAGFGWQVFQLDSRYLRQMTEVTPPASASGRATVKFLALQPVAKTSVRFLLVKMDGARDAQPVDGHDVIFKIE